MSRGAVAPNTDLIAVFSLAQRDIVSGKRKNATHASVFQKATVVDKKPPTRLCVDGGFQGLGPHWG